MVPLRHLAAGVLPFGHGHHQGPSNKTSTAGLDRYDNYINKVNVANEILQFRSKRLMREVVQRLHADVDYRMEKGLRTDELYNLSPVSVSFINVMPERRISFAVTAAIP